MVKLVAASGFDMTSASGIFSELPDASPTTATSAKVVIHGAFGFQVTVKGEGFTYDEPESFPATGTIFSVASVGGNFAIPLSITNLALDVAQMRLWLDQGPAGQAALLNEVFGGDDRIYGGRDGSNNLFGLSGHDLIVGGVDDDVLHGNAGADTLNGGRGADILFGDAGADAFVFRSTLDSRKLSVADTIVDLENTDRIDLRAIDANITKDGNQAFELVGAFTGKAAQMTLRYDAASELTLLSADVDGDGTADMVITIEDDHSDFTNFVT